MAAVTATETMGTPLNQEPLPKPQHYFSRTDAFLVHGAVKAGSDTIRWSAQFPQQLRYDGIAMVLPGYGGIKQTSRGLREAMVEQGVPTVTYEPAADTTVHGGTASCTRSNSMFRPLKRLPTTCAPVLIFGGRCRTGL